MDYVYQIQKKQRSRWIPVYPYGSATPMEFKDLDLAMQQARIVHCNCDDLRVVKIETYIIHDFSI